MPDEPTDPTPPVDPATDPTDPAKTEKTYTRSDMDRIIAAEVRKATERYADYDDLKAAADATKSETQKTLDALAKERDDLTKELSVSKREAALIKAGIPEDEWDEFAEFSATQIGKIAAKLAKPGEEKPSEPPQQRGRERLVPGSGKAPDKETSVEELVKDLF